MMLAHARGHLIVAVAAPHTIIILARLQEAAGAADEFGANLTPIRSRRDYEQLIRGRCCQHHSSREGYLGGCVSVFRFGLPQPWGCHVW